MPQRTQLAFYAIAAAAVLLWLAGQVLDVLLLGFAGVLLGLFLSGIGRWVARRTGLPHKLVTAMVCLALAGAGTAAVWLVGPQVSSQLDELTRTVPQALRDLRADLEGSSWGRALLSKLGDAGSLVRRTDMFSRATGLFSTSLGILTSFVVFLFAGLFIAFEPSTYHDGLVRLIPHARRPRAREVLGALGHALRRWMLGKLLSMAIIGALTWLGLHLIGIPLAPALALLAAALTFVPYIGPVVSSVPAVLLGLSQDRTTGLYVLLLYACIQGAESYLVTPLIQRRAVSLPPALTLLSQALLGSLAGALGIVVATPFAAVVLVLAKKLYVEDILDDGDAGAQGGQASSPDGEGQ